MSTPATHTFKLYQGQTWRFTLRLRDDAGTPLNLTGYTARMHVRESVESETLILDLTTENDGLEIDPLAGEIAGDVSAVDTADLPLNFEPQTWVYDLEIVSDAIVPVVTRVMQGNISASPEVTR